MRPQFRLWVTRSQPFLDAEYLLSIATA